MLVLFFLLLTGAALILQATIFNYITIMGVKPDLVMLLVVLIGFLLSSRDGAYLGFAGGIVEDLFTGNYIGLNALSKMAAGYLAGVFGERFYRESTAIATCITFASVFAGYSLNYLLLLYTGVQVLPFVALSHVIMPTAIYTSLLTPFFYRKIWRFIQQRSRDLNL